MSITLPKNFDSLVAKYADLRDPLTRLAEFVQAHSSWDVIDSRVLANELRDVDPWSLARAVQVLIDTGALLQLYAVTTPSGALAENRYYTPLEIPGRLPDRFNQYFDTAEQEVIPVLVAPEQR
jgi:hypothetical protein